METAHQSDTLTAEPAYLAPAVPLTSLTRRKKHFIRKHRYAKAFLDAGYVKQALRLSQCQESQVLCCCQTCGKSWWVISKCKQRFCPLCSFELSRQRGDSLVWLCRAMQHPKLLTLTMPRWTGIPSEGIQFLRSHFNILRKHRAFAQVQGGAYQIELKEKEDGWHIHMHALLDAPFLPYQRLAAVWSDLINVSHAQVDIRAADTEEAKRYVAKYVSKTLDYASQSADIVAWYEATLNQRLFATFGTWYNVALDELDPEKPVFQPAHTCPYCGAEHTMFLARDGPFVYGGETWSTLRSYFVGPDGETRPIPGWAIELGDVHAAAKGG